MTTDTHHTETGYADLKPLNYLSSEWNDGMRCGLRVAALAAEASARTAKGEAMIALKGLATILRAESAHER